MKFTYPSFEVELSSGEEPITIYRPVVPVVIHGPKRSLLLRALLDTGADYSVLSSTVARHCGIEVDSDRAIIVDGVGGGELEIAPAQVHLELIAEAEERHSWNAEVFFGKEDGLLFGQLGCLEYFDATFKYASKLVELFPVDRSQSPAT